MVLIDHKGTKMDGFTTSSLPGVCSGMHLAKYSSGRTTGWGASLAMGVLKAYVFASIECWPMGLQTGPVPLRKTGAIDKRISLPSKKSCINRRFVLGESVRD